MDTTVKPLVSIIVPVYKVEQYLCQCVDSILQQTYNNLEIILVDDGSPDRCSAICDAYAVMDSRVTVVHQKNGGLSDARNVGLSVINGAYLTFVDSDDWLPGDCISWLYRLIQEYRAQLAIGSSDRVDENGNALRSVDNVYTKTSMLNKKEAMADMLQHGCSAWARLYQRSIHERILFPKGEINEDEAILLQILDRCEQIVTTERVVYHYRCRADSITTNSFSKRKLIWQKHCADNLQWIMEHEPQLTQAAAARYRGSLLWSLREIALLDDDISYWDEKQKMLKLLQDNRVLFDGLSFDRSIDRILYYVLTRLGFCAYRALLRGKRRITA